MRCLRLIDNIFVILFEVVKLVLDQVCSDLIDVICLQSILNNNLRSNFLIMIVCVFYQKKHRNFYHNKLKNEFECFLHLLVYRK